MSEVNICGRTLDEFLATIEKFHCWTAPGVVLGGLMVDWAQEMIHQNIGPDTEADAIVETLHCLPDAVQLFTPCTFGNGWMKALDWDKFALCLYDKHKLMGYRVWLNLEKTRNFPNLYNWYMRLVPKKDLPLEVLLKTILDAGRNSLSIASVKVTDFYKPVKKGQISVCSSCGEAYSTVQGKICLSCQGKGYYEK